MTASPVSGQRRRLTLRFVDPELERQFQADAAQPLSQVRIGPLVAVGLWTVGGALAPGVTGSDAGPIYVIAGLMAAANLTAVGIAGWATTRDRQQVIGFVLNVLAGLAVLTLAALSGAFDRYAAPALMLIGVFAFIVLRLQFVFAAVVTAIYVVCFAAFGLATGAPGLPLSLFLLAATVIVACGGTYLIEDGRRHEFVQARAIAGLHEQVDRLFHQYLSPDVAAVLLTEHGREELGGEVVEVTVLFADLQGFTPWSERTDPAAVVEILNAYFAAAVPAIFSEGGTIVQFAGDAVMAVFNAPLRQADHALRAARASLALQVAVAPVAAAGADRPRFRVGLNTGPALVGNVGTDQIRSFTAIGDTTNLAARLQTYAAPGQVVIGERTWEQIRDVAEVRPLGSPALKGKSPVEVFELVRVGAAVADAPRSSGRPLREE